MRTPRSRSATHRLRRLVAATTLLAGLVSAGGSGAGTAFAVDAPGISAPSMTDRVVPEPAIVQPSANGYRLTDHTVVHATGGPAVTAIAARFAAQLRPATGFRLPVVGGRADGGGITLRLTAGSRFGAEGYQLDVTPRGVTIAAAAPAGLFYGVQTLRQLLPAATDATHRQRGPWPVPGGRIIDQPRFPYRGAMLDVSRHFFPVSVLERYIDEISRYKINELHLHLSDDQGWRIAIPSWPNLSAHGGSTEVGGGRGGFYTLADYRRIVADAAAHYITIVPEIDGPGHTNAALSSYAALNCDGVAPPLYTGIDVGFSSLCVNKDITYRFERDVLGTLASVTPGPYLHIGGDEAHSTTPADYATFEGHVLPIASGLGKTAIGWHDIAKVAPPTSAILQYWGTTPNDPPTAAAAARGNKIILSPAPLTYLDQKYTPTTQLGLDWAGFIEVARAYGWDPGHALIGVQESSILGVEAPLWSETLVTMANIEYLAFPRLPAIAELGWSPAATHDWNSFRQRLGQQGPRWTLDGINFYASPQVPWAPGTVGGVD